MADPGFGKGVSCACAQLATTPPFDAHAHRCNDCRETVAGLFANYTNSKGVSMETVETPLDPPLLIVVSTSPENEVAPAARGKSGRIRGDYLK